MLHNRTRNGSLRTATLGAGLGLLMAGSALAAEHTDGGMKGVDMAAAESQWEFSANTTLTTDYIFRGVSQTDQNPAIQGGLDVGYKWLYAGFWGSNLDFGGIQTPAGELVDVANIEIDWYGGVKTSLNGVEVDVGVIYYSYPGAHDSLALVDGVLEPLGELDYWEIKAGLSGKVLRGTDAGVTAYYSPDYTGQLGDTWTVEGSFETALFKGFALSGTVGYIENTDGNAILADGAESYLYWNTGLSKTFKEKFTLDVRYWDTDGGSECGNVTVFQCDSRVVGSVGASF